MARLTIPSRASCLGERGGRGWRKQFYATGLTGWQRAAMGYPGFGCAKLRAEWIYQLGGEERRTAVELAEPGRAAESVVIEADCPSDVHTTGIRLCCL